MTMDVPGTLLRVADRLERAASEAERASGLELPRVFFKRRAILEKRAAYQGAADEARRGLAELDALGAPARDARDGINRTIAHIDPSLHLFQVGDSYVPHETALAPVDLRQHAGVLRERVRLESLGSDDAVRDALTRELRDVTARPWNSITKADLDRIATLWALPAHLRPEFPPSALNSRYELSRLVQVDWPPVPANHIRGELDHIRLHHVARAMADDPGVTVTALDAELRTILAKPDSAIDLADMERISLMARLPDARRPALVDAARTYGWLPVSKMSSWGYTPTNEGAVRIALDTMRRQVAEQSYVADPSFTREQATAALRALMARPVTQLDEDELIRASALAGLPEHLRPSLPDTVDATIRLGEPGTVLAPNGHAQLDAFAAVRTHLTDDDPGAMARELVRQDRIGAAIDLELVATLAKYPGMLDLVGIDAEFLHRQSIVALAAAGGGRTEDLATSLRIARDVVDRHPTTDVSVATIRAEALELAERNLARMAGERSDTYGRHPDYAEIGRFASIATLLHQMRGLASKQATSASEVLSW